MTAVLPEVRAALADVATARRLLVASDHDGVLSRWVAEVKPAGVAVHARQVPDPAVGAALLERSGSMADPSLTKKPGKTVLELTVTAADKGTALRRLRADLGAAGAIYPAAAVAALEDLTDLLG